MDRNQAIAAWNDVRDVYAASGLILPRVQMLLPDDWKQNPSVGDALMAMDAAGTLATDPNSAIPSPSVRIRAASTPSIDVPLIRPSAHMAESPDIFDLIPREIRFRS